MFSNTDDENINNQIGPPVYVNWVLANRGTPLLETLEFPLLSDARITGEETDGYGPYQFINPVPLQNKPGLIQHAIVVRMNLHIKTIPSTPMTKTNNDFYHGGGLKDEIAALSSLALGVRLKAGGINRRFEPKGDPLGRPIGWHHPPPCINNRNS